MVTSGDIDGSLVHNNRRDNISELFGMSNIIIPGEEIKVLDAKAYGSTLAMDLGEHNFMKDEEIQVDTLRARVTGKIFFVDKNIVKMKITKIEEKQIIH